MTVADLRDEMRRLAFLAVLGSAAGCATSPAPAPSAPRALAPAPAPLPAPTAAPTPAPPRFVELHAGGQEICGRTAAGEVWCWGQAVLLPGQTTFVARATPTRLDGLPPLVGFTIVNGSTVAGWDAHGQLSLMGRPANHAQAPFGVQHDLLVIEGLPTTGARSMRPAAAPLVVGARGGCLVAADHSLWCTSPLWNSLITDAPEFVRMPATASRAGLGDCSFDAQGAPQVVNASRDHRTVGAAAAPLAPFATRRLDELGAVTDLACWAHDAPHSHTGYARYDACGITADHGVRCTEPTRERTLTALLEGHGARAFDGNEVVMCVARDDGQVRCVANYLPQVFAPTLAMLPGVDARAGFAATTDVDCALAADGIPTCWGATGNELLGDGSTNELAAPVHEAALAGADLLTASGSDITCARMSAREVRCFGGLGRSHVEPVAIPLPEDVDRMVGSTPLCMRGARTKSWYCRDATASFFRGSLPGGWEPLRDTRGQLLGAAVVDVADDHGLDGIVAVTASGDVYEFHDRGNVQPLRFARTGRYPGHTPDNPVVHIAGFASGVLRDGTARVRYWNEAIERGDGPFCGAVRCATRDIPGARDVVGGLVVTRAGELVSVGDGTGPLRGLADHVAMVSKDGAVLFDDGKVALLANGSLRPVAGLPPLTQVAGTCGLTADHQVWCFGPRSHSTAPAYRAPLAVRI